MLALIESLHQIRLLNEFAVNDLADIPKSGSLGITELLNNGIPKLSNNLVKELHIF